MDHLKTALLRGAFRLAGLLPVRLTGAIGAGLGRLAYYLDARHRSISVRNLTRIYPGRSRAWRRRVARESFAELGRTMLELPHVFTRERDYLLSRVEVEGEDLLREALGEGKGAMVAACHHGNWELGALMFSLLDYPVEFYYRPLSQTSPDTVLRQMRERFGARLHPRSEPARWVIRALKKHSCVGLMVDQHIGEGMAVPFLGHMANTMTLPAAMVRLTGAPLLGVALHRIGRDFRFRLCFWRIETPEGIEDDETFVYRLSHAINQSFEPAINLRPEMWLWSHQRWKLVEEHEKDITEVVYGTP